jgi:hypothetical protein
MVEPKSPEFYKLIKAFGLLCYCSSTNQNRILNSRVFENHRKDFSKAMSISQSGAGNSQYGTVWIYCPFTLNSRRVPRSDLQSYIDKGCVKGYIPNKDVFINKNKTLNYNKSQKIKKKANKRKNFINEFKIIHKEFIKSKLSYSVFVLRYPNISDEKFRYTCISLNLPYRKT